MPGISLVVASKIDQQALSNAVTDLQLDGVSSTELCTPSEQCGPLYP